MMGWQLFLALLATVAADDASTTVTLTCPDGYQMVGTDCYFISADTHTGASAQHYCKKNGGHAAVIESEKEMNLLKETVLNTTVYLGVNLQVYRKYQFEFALKMAGHTGFTAFSADEPDNYGSEDCVIADISDGFAWKDVHCTELHPVLCKVAAAVGEKEASCGEDEHFFGESCFWASGRESTWSAAADECRARGMRLASIHSKQENDFLRGLSDEVTWIGLNDITTEGVYVWSDETPLDYQSWQQFQPGGGETQNCCYFTPSYGGVWGDTSCDTALRAACRGAPS